MGHPQQEQGLDPYSKEQQQQQQKEEGLLLLGTALARHPLLLAPWQQMPACLPSPAPPHPPVPAGASVCWALLLRLLLTPWGWQGLTWGPWLAV